MGDLNPTVSNADAYRTVYENDRVRVVEYYDTPGHQTTPHRHPGSVMHTLSSYRRRLGSQDGREAEVELKEPPPTSAAQTEVPLGPSPS